jgi:TolA-binding protein
MNNANKLRLIEDYYRGLLKGDDKITFKQLMKEDLAFKQDVKDYKSIFVGFESLHVENFQNNLFNFEAKYQTNNKTKVLELNDSSTNTAVIRPMKKVYMAAAAIALLICATFGYNQMNSSPFEDNFVADSGIAVHIESIRGGEQELPAEEEIKKQAFSAYQKGDYTKSVDLLNGYINDYPLKASKDFQSYLILGVSQLASEKTIESIETFEYVLNGKDSSYKQQSEWYLALANVKLDKYEDAEKILNKIAAQKGHCQKKDAIKLLDQL